MFQSSLRFSYMVRKRQVEVASLCLEICARLQGSTGPRLPLGLNVKIVKTKLDAHLCRLMLISFHSAKTADFPPTDAGVLSPCKSMCANFDQQIVVPSFLVVLLRFSEPAMMPPVPVVPAVIIIVVAAPQNEDEEKAEEGGDRYTKNTASICSLSSNNSFMSLKNY